MRERTEDTSCEDWQRRRRRHTGGLYGQRWDRHGDGAGTELYFCNPYRVQGMLGGIEVV